MYGGRSQIYGYLEWDINWEEAWRRQETFWSVRSNLYLDLGSGYMGVCIIYQIYTRSVYFTICMLYKSKIYMQNFLKN